MKLIPIISILCFSFNLYAKDGPPSLLFDEWSPEESMQDISKEISCDYSPSKKYAIITYGAENQDTNFSYIVYGKNCQTGDLKILGQGYRSTKVNWITLNDREIAILEEQIDCDRNALFIIDGKDGWDLIYKTPSIYTGPLCCLWSFNTNNIQEGNLMLTVQYYFTDRPGKSNLKNFKIPLSL